MSALEESNNLSKKRGKNFNDFEKSLIIELVRQKISIIENKKTDGTTTKAKERAWNEIATCFNQVAQTGIRTANQLHGLYLTLKKKAKKDKVTDRVGIYKTGGGTYTATVDSIGEKIISMLEPQFKPISYPYDSSAPLKDTQSDTVSLQFLDRASNEDENDEQTSETYTLSIPSTSQEKIIPETEDLILSIPFTSQEKISPEIENSSSNPKPAQRNSISGNKKSNIATDLVQQIAKRNDVKTNFDAALFKKKMEILDIEMETRKNELEISRMQLEQAKITLEILKCKKMKMLNKT